MQSHAQSKDLLGPQDAYTTGSVQQQQTDRGLAQSPPESRTGSVWDPAVGAFRALGIPLALSKSSISRITPDGRPTTPYSPYRSTTSSLSSGSITSSYAYSSGSKTPASQFSAQSNHSHGRFFENLPPEIYDCILQQLKSIHQDSALRICQTCYLRDLCSLALTSRSWDKAVVKMLYHCIYIVGYDSKAHLKRYKVRTGTRLKLLRRTLRERRFLAQLVSELHIPRLHPINRDLVDVVASMVMACPNLERLVGFHPVYDHDFDRVSHALSTRRRLKQHVWLVGENEAITQRSHKQLAPGLMDPTQKALFVDYHKAWSSLTTLFLYSVGQGILEKDIFINIPPPNPTPTPHRPGILHLLPSLLHLSISSFDIDDFTDTTLLHLPPLHSLRLQSLEGLTFWGLSSYARTRKAFGLRSLSLINLDITYISAVSNLLLHLKNLTRFTLSQTHSPEISSGETILHPLIASPSLQYLHWDICTPGTANPNLAASIRSGGFPRLRTLRAPSDHDGLLQTLCRPRAQIELATDWSAKSIAAGIPPGGLRAARRAAQQRLEDAWGTVQFKIVVSGEGGEVKEIFDLSGFMGTIGSRIEYSLEPDVEGGDCALMRVEDLIGNGGRGGGSLVGKKEDTCRGEWNRGSKGGEKWWGHRERERYQGLELMRFF